MNLRPRVLALGFAAHLFIFPPAVQAQPAQLIIHRAANFGTVQGLRIAIDGYAAGAIIIGQDFRAALSPGDHVISVVHTPNWWNVPRTNMLLRVRRGGIYHFTAVWKTDHVVLH